MPKFKKPFQGVKAREIYPTRFAAGEECPPELEKAARSLGVLDEIKRPAKTKAEASPMSKE